MIFPCKSGSANTQKLIDLCLADRRGGKIVKDVSGHLYDVIPDKRRAFARTILFIFQTALPLQRRPARIVVLSQFRENAFEIDLSVTGGTETPRAVIP